MYNAMLKHRDELLALISEDRLKLSSYPSMQIYCVRDGKYTKWYTKASDGTLTYLPKSERDLAEKLAEKLLIQTRLEANQKELYLVERYLEESNPSQSEIMKLLSPDSKYADLLCNKFKQNQVLLAEWEKEEFETNTSYQEHLKILSPTGNIVRSKSELMIDMFLAEHEATYRYESKLELSDGAFLFPDFTIMRTDGKKKYWEHCGRMDSPEYLEGFLRKVNIYYKNGIFINESLFLTFETTSAPLQMSDIKYVFDKINF